MAERRAVNKYYPPNWDPTKGSINRYNNSHPLRARARKIDQGVLTIRFEMPFNIWCLGCDKHVGMGVRFNAEKSKIGNYYSSPIYRFRMKCHLCDNYFEIHSDPSKFDYVVISGARKQVRVSEEQEVTGDSNESIRKDAKRKITVAMVNLEQKIETGLQNHCQPGNLYELKQWRSRWQDSFGANQLIRSQYRERRKKISRSKETDRKLLSRSSLKISLVEPTFKDRLEAKELAIYAIKDQLKRQDELKKQLLLDLSSTFRMSNRRSILKNSEAIVKQQNHDNEHKIKRESNV